MACGLAITGVSSAAEGDFRLDYRVERADVSTLPLQDCARIAQSVATKAGHRVTVETHPDRLAVISGGPAKGGWSFVVYCIVVGDRLAHVTQGISYGPDKSAAAGFVEQTHAALVKAGKPGAVGR